MANPYVPWSEEDGASDAQWHGQSGPGIACTPSAVASVQGQGGESGVVRTTPRLGYPQPSTGHAAEEEEEEEMVTLGFLALIVIIGCLAGLCSRKVEEKEAASESMYSNGGGYGDASSYSSGTSGSAYESTFNEPCHYFMCLVFVAVLSRFSFHAGAARPTTCRPRMDHNSALTVRDAHM